MATALRILSLLFIASASVPLTAQTERYVLGRRFIQLEDAAATRAEPAVRAGIADELSRALRAFFSLNFAGAVGEIDAARLALRHGADAVPEAERWANSLCLELEAQLVEAEAEQTRLRVRRLYPLDDIDDPESVTVRVTGMGAEPLELAIDELPLDITLPLVSVGEGDHRFSWSVLVDGEEMVKRERGLCVARDAKRRIDVLAAWLEKQGKPKDAEAATARRLMRRCRSMLRGRQQEIGYPALAMLQEAERLMEHDVGDGFVYSSDRPGTFWIDFVTEQKTETCRLFVPAGVDPKSPPPLVIAMHGAGGSENLFFEGESGLTPALCKERGWYLLTTQSTITGGAKVGSLLDAFGVRYPFDPRRVFVVGHSMGAMQATAAAVQHPERIAKVAALGGSGNVRNATSLRPVKFWIGVGSRDFAHRPALQMYKKLRAGGVDAGLKVYPEVGHVLIVQDALREVFAFFDGSGADETEGR